MKKYTIEEFAKLTGLSIPTLRRYDKLLKPLRTPGGQRRYTDEHYQILYNLGKIKKNADEFDTVIYCRVSTSNQKTHLENQIKYCEQFCIANGWKISKIIKDVGSAVNFNRKGLKDLLLILKYNKPKRIVIADKDRLARIGFDLLKNIIEINNCDLIVINDVGQNDKIRDIVEELVHIVHLYAMKIYGTRSYKRIKDLENKVMETINEKEDN